MDVMHLIYRRVGSLRTDEVKLPHVRVHSKVHSTGSSRISHINILRKMNIRLNNGVLMPLYGLGLSHNGSQDFATAVETSLGLGVKLYDTAARYGTESILGDGVRYALDKGIISSRDDLFLTTKLWHSDARDVAGAVRRSLSCLGVDYLDLYLIHWPGLSNDDGTGKRARQTTWREMELLLDKDICRSIGVSNFLETHLHDLEETWAIPPQINQIEFNPMQYRKDLVSLCRDMKIEVEGYCPLGKGSLLSSPVLASIAGKYSCTSAQLCIAWSLQHDVVTIPKSTSKPHLLSNFAALDVKILKEDMDVLDNLDCDLRCTWNPTNVF